VFSPQPTTTGIRDRALARGVVAGVGVLLVLAAGGYLAAVGSVRAVGGALAQVFGPRVGRCETCVAAPAGAALFLDTVPVGEVLQIGRPAERPGQPPRVLYLARWLPSAAPGVRMDTTRVAVLDTAAGVPRLRLRRSVAGEAPSIGSVHFTAARPPIPVVSGGASTP
jgi:hypothetical protein